MPILCRMARRCKENSPKKDEIKKPGFKHRMNSRTQPKATRDVLRDPPGSRVDW
jgi:hypothetical protein